RPRQGVRVAGQDVVADSRQSLAEHLADVRVLTPAPHHLRDRVRVDVADGQLVEVRGEPAARLHVAARVDDQRLPRPLAVIRRETRQNSASFGVWMPWNLSTLSPILPVKPAAAIPPSTSSRWARSRNQTPFVMILSKAKPSSAPRRHSACTNSGYTNGSPPV